MILGDSNNAISEFHVNESGAATEYTGIPQHTQRPSPLGNTRSDKRPSPLGNTRSDKRPSPQGDTRSNQVPVPQRVFVPRPLQT